MAIAEYNLSDIKILQHKKGRKANQEMMDQEEQRQLKELEKAGDTTSRLALLEEHKNMPINSVWNYFCEKNNVPAGSAWLDEVKQYEKDVLAGRI